MGPHPPLQGGGGGKQGPTTPPPQNGERRRGTMYGWVGVGVATVYQCTIYVNYDVCLGSDPLAMTTTTPPAWWFTCGSNDQTMTPPHDRAPRQIGDGQPPNSLGGHPLRHLLMSVLAFMSSTPATVYVPSLRPRSSSRIAVSTCRLPDA